MRHNGKSNENEGGKVKGGVGGVLQELEGKTRNQLDFSLKRWTEEVNETFPTSLDRPSSQMSHDVTSKRRYLTVEESTHPSLAVSARFLRLDHKVQLRVLEPVA